MAWLDEEINERINNLEGFTNSLVGNNLVFRPGGVAGGVVHTTWTSVMAARALVQGWAQIQIDSSIAPALVDLGTWDLTKTELIGFVGDGLATQKLTAPDGAHFTNFKKQGGALTIENLNDTTALITTGPGTYYFEAGGNGQGSARISNVGLAPFIDASGMAAGSFLSVRVQRALIQGPLTGPGGSPAFRIRGATSAFPFEQKMALLMGPGSVVYSNMIESNLVAPVQTIFTSRSDPSALLALQTGVSDSNGTSYFYSQGPQPFGASGVLRQAITPFWFFPAIDAAPGPTPVQREWAGVVRYDSSSGDTDLTLPELTPVVAAIGDAPIDGALDLAQTPFTIVNEVGGNNLLVSPAAGNYINNSTDAIVIPPGGSATFHGWNFSYVSFGLTWMVTSSHSGPATAAYTVTNPVTNRAFDTTTVTTAALAEAVGTLIADLRAKGLVGL